MILKISPYTLNFNFTARTSRGSMNSKTSLFIEIREKEDGPTAYGEINTLQGLSVDQDVDYVAMHQQIATWLEDFNPVTDREVLDGLYERIPIEYPALRMGLETAFLDLIHGCEKRIFNSEFYTSERGIPINGLLWMGSEEYIREQSRDKLKNGFRCLKMKIGGLHFDKECDILSMLRNQYSPDELVLRLDANGAFKTNDVWSKLSTLAQFQIHSIEQPLAPDNSLTKELFKSSPIKIALDEELIGKTTREQRAHIWDLNPHFVILKPSLLGGFKETARWIKEAEERKVGWWITSALESNIGLNAIAQFTDTYVPHVYQGLGTGQIYKNNFESPLSIRGEHLHYNQKDNWYIKL